LTIERISSLTIESFLAASSSALTTSRPNGAAGLQTGRVRADLKVGPSIA